MATQTNPSDVAEHHSAGSLGQSYSLESGKDGYIPISYVRVVRNDPIQDKDWYFGNISRSEAEMIIIATSVTGTFLVRDSSANNGDYTLTVLDMNGVKHYLIRHLDEGGFYINPRSIFNTVTELVKYYKKDADGLCCLLNSTCTKEMSLSYKVQLMLEVPREFVTLERLLGKTGQFGELYKGRLNKAVSVAIRVVETGIMLPLALIEEAYILKKLHHPNLVKLYGVCIKDGPSYIITEFMPRGSLFDYLQSSEGHKLELPQLTDMAAQIAAGMACLEMNKHVHCSLSARSVLINDNKICKVADYGFARLLKDDKRKFDIKWLAPEFVQLNRFSIKSDVWSFGILLYELMTRGIVPYPGMTDDEVLLQLEIGYRMPAPLNTPEHLYDIMLTCWREKPTDRPTFETLQQQMEDFENLKY